MNRNTHSIIEPYFSVRLEPGRKAEDVFADAKQAAIAAFERQIRAIDAATFDGFASTHLSPDWRPDTVVKP